MLEDYGYEVSTERIDEVMGTIAGIWLIGYNFAIREAIELLAKQRGWKVSKESRKD